MTKKIFLLLILLSVILSFISVIFITKQSNLIYNGSELPGQLGKIDKKSKIINHTQDKGFLSYGPYVELTEGTYTFDITYSASNAQDSKFDIVTNMGKDILLKGNLSGDREINIISSTLNINNNQPNNKIEVRVFYAGKGSLSLHSISIKKTLSLYDFIQYFSLILVILITLFYLYSFSKAIFIFILILCSILLLLFISDAYTKYYKYKEITYKEMPLTTDLFKYYIKESIEAEKIRITAPTLQKDETIESFYLMVDKKDLDKLNSDLPLSGIEQYIDARLKINDGKSTKVKMRYRGGSAWNWRYPRKSMKIKLKSNNLYNMMTTLNFSVLYSQDMFVEPITQKIAKSMGALAPEVKTVRMFINGEYEGLYLYLDQVDESFLRKNKLMPGSIYDGDYSLKQPWSSYIGENGIAKLWYDSTIWDKKAARNAEQKKIREDIQLLIKAVNNYNDYDFFKFANTYLSDQYYTYLALDVLWGTHHHDYFHNHKIYFDPYKGKYSAISWDVRFWKANQNKDNSYYPLIERIGLNPLLEFKKDKELYRILQSIDKDYINKIMKDEERKLIDSYFADNKRKKISINPKLFPWKETFNPPQLTVATREDLSNIFKTYSDNLIKRLDYLNKLLEDTTIKYKITYLKNDTIEVLFSVNGNSPVKLQYNDMILYPGRNIMKGNALKLDAAGYGKTHLINSEQFYTLSFNAKEFTTQNFTYGFNAVTGGKVFFQEDKNLEVKPTDSIHPWKIIQEEKHTKSFSGHISINETLEFNQYTTVIIEPGTTFIMDSNTSIYFYGKVIAKGTKEQPIKFIAKNPKKPWGLVAVQGQATSGSKFEYCEFSNGSVDTKNLIHYTSQFNIHDTKDFEIKNCFIGKNHIGDDAMHIAYANGVVDNCTFDGARSDGLDIDIADVTVSNSTFKNSGNDGLDVMTTKMTAYNNTFMDTGDKGISVGEWSEANITNSTFTNTVIGMEIKDKSKVTASNLTFINSKEKAINLYNKNKRYDQGGFLKASNITFIGNDKVIADKRSKVLIDE